MSVEIKSESHKVAHLNILWSHSFPVHPLCHRMRSNAFSNNVEQELEAWPRSFKRWERNNNKKCAVSCEHMNIYARANSRHCIIIEVEIMKNPKQLSVVVTAQNHGIPLDSQLTSGGLSYQYAIVAHFRNAHTHGIATTTILLGYTFVGVAQYLHSLLRTKHIQH